MIKETVEYKLVKEFYGSRVAERSQVPLMNHINEGLKILDMLEASLAAKRAFCLHPLFQDNDCLYEHSYLWKSVDPEALMLVMEYRNIANAFLSDKVNKDAYMFPNISPLYEVNQMLIADKVQNYKDFLLYHKATHPRAVELNTYFNLWLTSLTVSHEDFDNFCKELE